MIQVVTLSAPFNSKKAREYELAYTNNSLMTFLRHTTTKYLSRTLGYLFITQIITRDFLIALLISYQRALESISKKR